MASWQRWGHQGSEGIKLQWKACNIALRRHQRSTAHVHETFPTTLQVLHGSPVFQAFPLWQVAPPHGQQLRKQSAATVRPPWFTCRISGSGRDPLSAFCNISLRPRNIVIILHHSHPFPSCHSQSRKVCLVISCPSFTLHRRFTLTHHP